MVYKTNETKEGKRKKEDYPDNSTVEIRSNTQDSPGDEETCCHIDFKGKPAN